MNKLVVVLIFIVFTITLVFLLLVHNAEKEFNESLLLHQKLNIRDVDSMTFSDAVNEKSKISTKKQKEIVKWFNEYPAHKVTSSDSDVPAAEATITIKQNDGGELSIHYDDGLLKVMRDLVAYELEEDAPELEAYFENRIK